MWHSTQLSLSCHCDRDLDFMERKTDKQQNLNSLCYQREVTEEAEQ